MRCRAEICALLLWGAACGFGSAERALAPPPIIRVAASADLDRDQLESGTTPNGDASHIADLLQDRLPAGSRVVAQSGASITLELGDGVDLASISARLRAPGLISARVEGDRVVARLDRSVEGVRLDESHFGAEGGTHELGPAPGLILLPRAGASGVALELVPAPVERHWRLLNGNHVQIVPLLRRQAALQLEPLESVELVELPSTTFVGLQLGTRLSPAQRATIAGALDIDALAGAVCGGGCRASYPIEVEASAVEPGPISSPITVLYLEAASAEATGARLIAHQLLEQTIEIALEPVALEALAARVRSGDFDLALVPMSTDPTVFRRLLSFSTDDELAITLIPLWNLQLYAAHDSSICGVEPDSVTSWAWLASIHPCEDGGR